MYFPERSNIIATFFFHILWIYWIMDIVKNSFISKHIFHIILFYMPSYNFKAYHNMIITRNNFLLPHIFAFQVHETFSNHRGFYP